MVRTSVLVSGGGANLQAIIDANFFGQIPEFELCAVISSVADAKALDRARRANIPTYIVEREIFPNNASFCNALLNKLRDLDTDLVVLAGFTEKLNYPLLHFYKDRVINVQPALFPAFCTESGFDPIEAIIKTLKMGLKCTGATSYFLTEEDDGFGPIILQKPVVVKSGDNVSSLQERIMRDGEWPVLTKTLELYCSGKLHLTRGIVTIDE